MHALRNLSVALLLPLIAEAQYRYPRHNFTIGAGAGVPQADLSTFFDPKIGVNAGYGYRFHRYFQADVGFETVFGAAGVRDFLETEIGSRRIRDYQYLLPFGGRTIIPLAGGRLQFHAGGGGAYMRYAERISQPNDYYRIDCPVCTARSGWGYYAGAGFSVAIDRYQHFRFGLSSRIYRGHTQGDSLGAIPGLRTRDHWINSSAEFGISF